MTDLLLLANATCSHFDLRKPTGLSGLMIVGLKRLFPYLPHVYCVSKAITSQDPNRLQILADQADRSLRSVLMQTSSFGAYSCFENG